MTTWNAFREGLSWWLLLYVFYIAPEPLKTGLAVKLQELSEELP